MYLHLAKYETSSSGYFYCGALSLESTWPAAAPLEAIYFDLSNLISYFEKNLRITIDFVLTGTSGLSFTDEELELVRDMCSRNPMIFLNSPNCPIDLLSLIPGF